MHRTMLYAVAGLTLAAGAAPRPAAAQAAAAPPGAATADARFMSGMILHHAQALVMAGWAPSHGASHDVALLCRRIVISQRDEIGTMSRWLTAHHVPVPDTSMVTGDTMPGMAEPMLMPGMLTNAQLAQLDSARGPAFDRLFLEDMIRHHEGAISMVDDLMGTPGGASDNLVYTMASDISSGQLVEIHRMQALLASLPAAGR